MTSSAVVAVDLEPVEESTLTAMQALDVMWAEATTPGDSKIKPEEVYGTVTRIFDGCRARRDEVEVRDPWKQGAVLVFAQKNFDQWKLRGLVPQDYSYSVWATEMTGCQPKTWMQWRRVVRILMETNVGKAYLAQANLTPDQVPAVITMDKAARAIAKIARGQLEAHQLEALIDPDVTSAGMRHAIVRSQEEQDAEDAAFVANGSGRPEIVFDANTLRIMVFHPDATEPLIVAQLSATNDPLIQELQDEMVQAIKAKPR